MIEQPRIRAATHLDADALAALGERTFRDTFAADNSVEDMDAYIAHAFSVDRIAAELAGSENRYLVAFLDGDAQPAGYVKLRTGTAHASAMGPAPIELQRLYADRRALGRGVGAALMHAALRTAASAGHQTLWLGVWERNARAIAFYQRWHFEKVGDHVFRLGSDDQTDWILARRLSGID